MDAILASDKTEAFSAYADRHELFDMFENLISKLLIDRPVDPIQWMIDKLQEPIG